MEKGMVCRVCGRDCIYNQQTGEYDLTENCASRCRGAIGGSIGKIREDIRWEALTQCQQKEEMKEAFFKRVDKTDSCWIWRNASKGKGKLPYGSFRFRRKSYSAHRLSWTMFNGEIPKNICVLHKCDNASCVNPEHLFLGSHLDNERDKLSKGRGVCEVLNKNLVIEIKTKLAMRVPSTALAEEYNVSMTTIHSIKSGKTWKDVGADINIPMSTAVSMEDVIEIKKKLAMKIPCAHIAREYGVNRSVISKIKNGKTWRDV